MPDLKKEYKICGHFSYYVMWLAIIIGLIWDSKFFGEVAMWSGAIFVGVNWRVFDGNYKLRRK